MDTMNLLKKSYMDAGISPEVYDYCHGISSRMKDRFAQIDQVAELNQIKVLRAMQKNRVPALSHQQGMVMMILAVRP